jgi:uncharacterized protein
MREGDVLVTAPAPAFGLPLEFEWDENKRLSNIEKHKLDFVIAKEIFSGATLLVKSGARSTETRWLAIGMLNVNPVTIVFTIRDGTCRIISARRARHGEIRAYRAAISR